VNPRYDFIEYLLRQAATGTHQAREDHGLWWQHATLRGEATGLMDHANSGWIYDDLRDAALTAQNALLVARENVPADDLLPWQTLEGVDYFVRHTHEFYDWKITPVPADEALLLELNDMANRATWDDGSISIWNDLIAQIFASVPDEYSALPLTFGLVDDVLHIGTFDFAELASSTLYSPLGNYWRDHRMFGSQAFNMSRIFVENPPVVSPEIAHFEGAVAFGVYDMQTLLDLFISAGEGEAGYIPREAYLLQWLDMFSAQVLADYAYAVRLHFMGVPDIVPQRVHDLTHDIVADYTGDFERIMAIRDFLLQFPYTLTPAPVPPGVCFVDHFLFEGQEGYCTYFASAMAIMARIAGVPSRYVEGFVLPTSINHMENVTVTNRMAHAWVEVYLEGFGWHIIEATPTYAFLANPSLPAPVGGSGAQPFGDDWYRDLADRMGDPEMWTPDMFQPPAGQGAGQGAAAQTAEEEPEAAAGQLSPWWLLLLPAAIGVFLLSRFIRVLYAHIRVSKLPPNQQVIAYFEGLLAMVAYYTVPMEAGETPKIYGGHKGKRFAYKSDSIFFKDLINLYYKARYSPHEITQAESELMEEAYFDMVKLIKSKRLPAVYWYLRYIRQVGVVS
ncbi:MAG: transglutaminase-like domain-containing protein, partial [Defluviitaleaceae bacterium]|nr:transglutaminase-like domain-containing protein [Defluviitaleaceae bacterium]